ncbi:MAG: diguanylate cyclase [Chitinivibrionales bacterium]|nr:diguanylate cyclase [Chitinivibrionales bacterium]
MNPRGIFMNTIHEEKRHTTSGILMTFSAFILVVVLGFVDYLTGYRFDFSLIYLIPVLLVAWFIGRWQGFTLAAFSAIIWLIADKTAGHDYGGAFYPFWNMITRLLFFSLTSLFLSGVRHSLVKEEELSRIDALTGIMNGVGFSEQAAEEINRSRRFKNPLSIAYMGVNNLKKVNEELGHSIGNAVLRRVAQALLRNCRSFDTVSRIAGDEFAILLPQTGPEQAEAAVSKLQKSCVNTVKLEKWPITFSIGVVTFFSAPTTIDEMIRAADGLMYTAKDQGPNVIKYRISD